MTYCFEDQMKEMDITSGLERKKHIGVVMDHSDQKVPEKVVLVVDDDEMLLRIFEKRLTKAGYRAITARSALEGLDLLREHHPPVVVVDWMMPGMDGIEFCRQVRLDDQFKDTYLIMVTSLDAQDSKVYALEAGADDFLRKPINYEELIARIRVAFRIKDFQLEKQERIRLEGILEMAGAASHELNQPLQIILGKIELLLMELDPSHPLYTSLSVIKEQALRIASITKKIGRIVRYESKEYPGGMKMVDIHRSSEAGYSPEEY